MAVSEENWQTKLSTVAQRTTFIFNNELLSDVKFVVPVSPEQDGIKTVIPAHKFVLAISSPVFFAMFYGQMAETKDSIELPDCECESLLELFRFLYGDLVNLSGNNVMQVLYLANKYMVPSLAKKCAEYLRDNLTASNVLCILPQAQKFEDKDLEDRCWKVIEIQTEEAVTSDEFVTVQRSLLESVVKRELLNVKEVKLFKAVDRWATNECQRKGFLPDGQAKRLILGEEIIKAIRFPLMSQEEFVTVALNSHILNTQEVEELMKQFCEDTSTSSASFLHVSRARCLKYVHRCNRFTTIVPQSYDTGWGYTRGMSDSVSFFVSKRINLQGVQHFGTEGGKYTVFTKVKDTSDGSSLANQTGFYSAGMDKTNQFYGFDVLFDKPVCLEPNKIYKLKSFVTGPNSCYGDKGKVVIDCEGVRFNFRDGGNNNGTSVRRGQFPSLIFSKIF
ncbi:BTB/POZ domain-containing protein 6-B-like [Stylophora pistillata]|nr:BTB/POZ domain-containing protein 6-B-like [Stylophora pistillata]